MSIRPLHDNILVKRLAAEEKSAGGIIIPGNSQEKPNKGEVIAVGTGKKSDTGEKITLDVQKGDIVLFSQYGGNEVSINGEDLIIMREDSVLAILEGEAASSKAA